MDAEEQSQMAGAQVGHGVDDFKAGESVVLTLADQSVLEEDGNSYALNESEDMLENVNMVRWLLLHRRPHAPPQLAAAPVLRYCRHPHPATAPWPRARASLASVNVLSNCPPLPAPSVSFSE